MTTASTPGLPAVAGALVAPGGVNGCGGYSGARRSHTGAGFPASRAPVSERAGSDDDRPAAQTILLPGRAEALAGHVVAVLVADGDSGTLRRVRQAIASLAGWAMARAIDRTSGSGRTALPPSHAPDTEPAGRSRTSPDWDGGPLGGLTAQADPIAREQIWPRLQRFPASVPAR